ncbi:MAG: putative Aquaporin AqpM [Candidatus Thorarchaeota archaeon]|nr:MAG: putative Aquaporin AqpM [Candidatus Thorarchaeota archaeon]
MKSNSLIAEFVGTFTLVLFGAGTAAVTGSVLAAALAFGFALMVIVVQFGKISGAHVNPAVTLGLLADKKIERKTAIGYILFQLAGGAFAGLVLWLVLPPSFASTYGATTLTSGLQVYQGFVIEMILTFLLVGTIYQAAVNKSGGALTPVIIGGALTVAILLGGTLTGGSLNFARTLGPLISEALAGTLAIGSLIDVAIVYGAGTLAGGILATLVHSKIFKNPEE